MEVLQEKKENFLIEIIKASIIAIIIVVPIRFYIAQPFIVSGASMNPTFESGHYLIVDQLNYRFNEPERGEVVIFKFPKDLRKFFIKRIIGLPGETVQAKLGVITITNIMNPDGFVLDEPYVDTRNQTFDSYLITLAPDEYLVLGDNRRGSSDSRIWGPLKEDLLIGRAFLRLLPVSAVSKLPGDYSDNY